MHWERGYRRSTKITIEGVTLTWRKVSSACCGVFQIRGGFYHGAGLLLLQSTSLFLQYLSLASAGWSAVSCRATAGWATPRPQHSAVHSTAQWHFSLATFHVYLVLVNTVSPVQQTCVSLQHPKHQVSREQFLSVTPCILKSVNTHKSLHKHRPQSVTTCQRIRQGFISCSQLVR